MRSRSGPDARPKKRRWPLGAACVALCLAFVALGAATGNEAEPGVLLRDDFSLQHLDDSKWERTRSNDFETEAVDVVDGRLRLAGATVGTDPRTVKFHGVRSRQPVVDLAVPTDISLELDWNDQVNGCYMTAGAYVCPAASQNPREEKSWLRLLYIGVPPGRNARCLISAKVAGRERRLLTENWPQERTGRKIGRQRIQIKLDGSSLVVIENGETILKVNDLRLDFGKAYLYLQHSTHSNYPLREVFFDDVLVRRLTSDQPQ